MLQALAVAAVVVGIATFAISGFLWRRTAGRRALASRLQPTDGLLQDIGCRKIRQQNGGGHYWVIYAGYRYSVGGKDFQGSRMFLDDHTFASEAAAETALGNRKAGDRVVVWYDPASPTRSALQQPAPPGGGIYGIVAIVGGAIAVAGAIAAFAVR